MSSYIQFLKETPKEKLPLDKDLIKKLMYKHFCQDMKRIASSQSSWRKTKKNAFVVSTFNVHFFQRGFSGTCVSNNMKDFLEFMKKEQPEFMLLQEVPSWDISKPMMDIGYRIAVSASCPECHELPEDLQVYDMDNKPRQCKQVMKDRRLRTMIAYCVTKKNPWSLVSTKCVRIDERKGQVSVATFSNEEGRLIALITLHLSVRCEPSRRLNEMKHVIRYCNSHLKACDMIVVAGDFNQAVESDYTPENWKILAEDMKRARVPLSDGVSTFMSKHNFLCSFKACGVPVPVVTCWGASRVDWIYIRDQSEGKKLRIEDARVIGTDISDHAPLSSTFSFM